MIQSREGPRKADPEQDLAEPSAGRLDPVASQERRALQFRQDPERRCGRDPLQNQKHERRHGEGERCNPEEVSRRLQGRDHPRLGHHLIG